MMILDPSRGCSRQSRCCCLWRGGGGGTRESERLLRRGELSPALRPTAAPAPTLAPLYIVRGIYRANTTAGNVGGFHECR